MCNKREAVHSHVKMSRIDNCPVIADQVGHRSCDRRGPGVLSVLGEQSQT